MPRRIPDALMPHQATITPWTGEGSTGPLYGAPWEPVRGQFDGAGSATGRSVTVGGQDLVIVGRLYLDPVDLPPLSKVHSSVDGSDLLVAGTRIFDGGGLRYLLVTLGQ